ncbi:MAG: hypothetical protein U0587_21380 [Candidatus Binatia bacterium]
MLARAVVILGCLTVLLAAGAGAAEQPAAAPAAAADAAAAPPFPAWDAFVDGLRDLWPKMAAKLPERLRDDPQVQQEVGRLMLEALAAQSLQAISGDGDHPVFLPHANATLNIWQPNADTTYRLATIAPGGTYRLRGDAGSLRIFVMGQFGPLPTETGAGVTAISYHDFSKLRVDNRGRFDVIVSPTRPAGHRGDWWQLDARTTSFLLRQIASDWVKERDPTISIERLDIPVYRPRPDAATLQSKLRRLPLAVGNTATYFVNHVEQLRRDGFVNKLKVFDVVSNLGGLLGQFYYEGAYQLARDEALIVETAVPKKCRYSSLILTNDLYETTDWYNNQSSLNGSQLRVDKDGILRVVVSATDPGVPNWLDTAGYPSGVIQGRWMECNATPIPTVRKLAVGDVRKVLPADTPAVTPHQREQAVRDRRAAAQHRPLW